MTAKKRGRPKKKKAAKKADKKPAVEKSEVETTPWPRAGDSKEFTEILSNADLGETKTKSTESQEAAEQALKVDDVAEWVKWPFQFWSVSQKLPPIIKDKEAIEIAEPLTRIMNRHGVGEVMPPDLVDGMQVVGRTIPIIKRGNDLVRAERQKRQAGQTKQQGRGRPVPQGAPEIKPKEI